MIEPADEGGALAQLADEADASDSATPGDARPGGAPPGVGTTVSPNVGAIVLLLSTFRTIAGAMLAVQSLDSTLNDANVARCAEVLAPVADKYGIDLGAAWAGPEAAAILVAGPILWTAAQQLNLELKAKRARPVQPVAEPSAPTTAEAEPADPGGAGLG